MHVRLQIQIVLDGSQRTPILLRLFEPSSSSWHPNFSSPPSPPAPLLLQLFEPTALSSPDDFSSSSSSFSPPSLSTASAASSSSSSNSSKSLLKTPSEADEEEMRLSCHVLLQVCKIVRTFKSRSDHAENELKPAREHETNTQTWPHGFLNHGF